PYPLSKNPTRHRHAKSVQNCSPGASPERAENGPSEIDKPARLVDSVQAPELDSSWGQATGAWPNSPLILGANLWHGEKTHHSISGRTLRKPGAGPRRSIGRNRSSSRSAVARTRCFTLRRGRSS